MTLLRRSHSASSLLLVVMASGGLLLACGGRVHVGDHDGGTVDGGGTPCGPVTCAAGLVCCNASCGICTEPGGGCIAVECEPGDCSSNADCGGGEYCARPDGTCGAGALGTCEPRPSDCITLLAPVCGCDGTTYGNSCVAAGAGVNVDHEGECGGGGTCDAQDARGDGPCFAIVGVRWDGERCESMGGCTCVGADCDETYPDVLTCERAHAGCASCGAQDVRGTGVCGAAFGVFWDGSSCTWVSGCDCAGTDCDAAYETEGACEAAHAHCGPSPGCRSHADCDVDSERCYFPDGDCGDSGARTGECRLIPPELPCSFEAPPVCGCDGTTYGCESAANASGVSLRHREACETPVTCGTIAGLTCGPDSYCEYFGTDHWCGGADGGGVCLPRPSTCEDIDAPVCACDGTIYSNACEAHAAGFGVAARDAMCAAPGG